jgi:hypothetical protein
MRHPMLKKRRPHDISVHARPSSYNFVWSRKIPTPTILHLVFLAVERIPDTSHTLVQTLHGLGDSLQCLAACAAQEKHFVEDLVGLHVAHTDSLFLAADVATAEDGVSAGSRGDCDFDLRVGFCEALEVGLEEVAGGLFVSESREVNTVGLAYFIPLLLPAQSQ